MALDAKLQKKVDELKAQGHSLRKVRAVNKEYIIRSMTRSEYRDVHNTVEELAEKVRSQLTEKYTPEFKAIPEDDPEAEEKVLAVQEKMQAEMQELSKGHLEEIDALVLKVAVVNPVIESLDSLLPGTIPVLRDQILLLSGFDDSPEVEDL